METKLIEFSPDQLQHAFDEICAGIQRLETFPVVREYQKHGTNKDHKTVLRYLNLCLWKVQLLTAIGQVAMSERVIKN